MKKSLLLSTTFLLIFLTSASLWATPNLSVTNDTFEFGAVPEGTVIKHNFIIKNNGDETLVIKKILTG